MTDKKKEVAKKKRKWPWILLGVFLLFVVLGSIGSQQRVWTQDQINDLFAKNVAQSQRINHLNPTEEIVFELDEDIGVLSIAWEQGQSLTADITVSEDGKEFVVSNVQVPDVGFLETFFEETGQRVIDSVLEEFLKAVPREYLYIEINEGELVMVFRE